MMFLSSQTQISNGQAKAHFSVSDVGRVTSGYTISIFTHRDSSTKRPTAICSTQEKRREDPEKILQVMVIGLSGVQFGL